MLWLRDSDLGFDGSSPGFVRLNLILTLESIVALEGMYMTYDDYRYKRMAH